MSILVTGASGFVGSTLVRALAQNGRRVRGAVRHGKLIPLSSTGVEWCEVGDVGPSTDWSLALAGVTTIVHLVARTHQIAERGGDPNDAYSRVNVEGTRRLAEQASKERVKRLIYVSSIKVNGERTLGRPFRATDEAAPSDPYGMSKFEAENVLRRLASESGVETVVIRPPLIYGPGVKGNFSRLMGLVASGCPLPFRSLNNRRSMVALENVVDLLMRCIDAPEACGRTFLVRDDDAFSTPELIEMIATAMQARPRLLRMPVSLLDLVGRVSGFGPELKRLCYSLEVDDSDTRFVLNWTPPLSAAEAVRNTVREFLWRGSRRTC